ncbi:MAG TPA: gephyrin-like molybdotransferase Glp [Kofleriaceae bacterium]|nr:gephyrin-like molybdotransferase Glp [Kofleriaceae bacterium]
MLSVAEARGRILDRVRPQGAEQVPLDRALGRFLAAAVTAGRDRPAFDNSAMDGFAVRAADLPGELPVAGAIAAGAAPGGVLAPGTAVRIMTGAPLPAGADAVVMREEAVDRGDRVELARPAVAGQHVRRAGEDIARGAAVLPAGARIGPGEIAVLASLGHASVPVGRRPRVTILSTGDELCPLGREPRPGQIISSNEHALAAQAAEAGAEVLGARLVADDRAAMEAALIAALDCDVLVSSGGVSVGDHDHVRGAMEAVGIVIDFWKVAMRPGKPVTFGVAGGGALCFGLPGNPVSSLVSFELFVRPTLLALAGASERERPRAEVVLTGPVSKSPGRAHYLRASLVRRGDLLEATPHGKQGSGMLSSLVGVDALVEVAAEQGDLPAGSRCPALLLRAV